MGSHGDSLEIVTNRALVDAADRLYYSDRVSGGLKVGAVDRSRPGNVRRLIAMKQRLTSRTTCTA